MSRIYGSLWHRALKVKRVTRGAPAMWLAICLVPHDLFLNFFRLLYKQSSGLTKVAFFMSFPGWRLKVGSPLCCSSLILLSHCEAMACCRGGVASRWRSCKIIGRSNRSTCSVIVTASICLSSVPRRFNISGLLSCPAPSYHATTVFKGHLKQLDDYHFTVAIWLPNTIVCLMAVFHSWDVVWSFVLSTAHS